MVSASIDIFDLSHRPRCGFKGASTLATMQSRGLRIENHPNRAFRQDDDTLCLVLASTEVFLLGSLYEDSSKLVELETSWQIGGADRTYLMPRRHTHAWFALQGGAVPEMLAKLCAVDFRPSKFSDLSIAQTSVARLNAIVVRVDREQQPAYYLLADSTCAAYMLACLKDAADEFGGCVRAAGILPSPPPAIG